MPLLVVGNLLRKLRNEVWALRPRTDKVHVAAQDIPELWDFVDADFANNTTYACHAVVIGLRPNGSVFLGICAHRAKLHELERPAVLADAVLLVKNRTARIKLDQNRGDNRNRHRKKRTGQRDHAMHGRADDFIDSCTTP